MMMRPVQMYKLTLKSVVTFQRNAYHALDIDAFFSKHNC